MRSVLISCNSVYSENNEPFIFIPSHLSNICHEYSLCGDVMPPLHSSSHLSNCFDLCILVQTRIASMTTSQIIKLCDFPLEWLLYFSRPIFGIVESHLCCFYMGAHQIKPSEKINVLMIYLLKMGTCDPSACDELDMKKNDVDLQLYNLNRIRYSFQSVYLISWYSKSPCVKKYFQSKD